MDHTKKISDSFCFYCGDSFWNCSKMVNHTSLEKEQVKKIYDDLYRFIMTPTERARCDMRCKQISLCQMTLGWLEEPSRSWLLFHIFFLPSPFPFNTWISLYSFVCFFTSVFHLFMSNAFSKLTIYVTFFLSVKHKFSLNTVFVQYTKLKKKKPKRSQLQDSCVR